VLDHKGEERERERAAIERRGPATGLDLFLT
jgi:hypothetical protein